jgi:3-oxoacyl-[acyl-carrier protein] reductase
MDLGIAGRRALICGSSQGLGRACAEALAAEGAIVVINGRDGARLDAVAAEIRAAHAGAEVRTAPGDLLDAGQRQAVIAAAGELDILVLNNRGPRPSELPELTDEDLAEALDLHLWAPLQLLRAVLPGMQDRGFGRVVTITSAMVAKPDSEMLASAAARTGFTALLKGIRREAVRHNVTINQLLPERIDSPRQIDMAHVEMKMFDISFEEARRRQAASIAAGRLGRPEELAAACAFLCSAQAGYISGVNLRVDGGSYPGLL